jgi:hypothetical protein
MIWALVVLVLLLVWWTSDLTELWIGGLTLASIITYW